MPEEKKDTEMTVKDGVIMLTIMLTVGWFGSPRGQGCTRMELETSWMSAGATRVEVIVVQEKSRSERPKLVAKEVRKRDPLATDIRYTTKDYGFCQ